MLRLCKCRLCIPSYSYSKANHLDAILNVHIARRADHQSQPERGEVEFAVKGAPRSCQCAYLVLRPVDPCHIICSSVISSMLSSIFATACKEPRHKPFSAGKLGIDAINEYRLTSVHVEIHRRPPLRKSDPSHARPSPKIIQIVLFVNFVIALVQFCSNA
jgi:hypothetical protein